MSEQVLEQPRSQSKERRRQRKAQKPKPKSKLKRILARYEYTNYKWIKTPDVGTFEEMWAKYHDKYEFWCGDIPPQYEEGEYHGYRLLGSDGDKSALKKWGKHKAWIDLSYKVDGKPVILVWKAA